MLVSMYSDMFDLVNDHLYYTFYNNISGTSFSQWLRKHVHHCRKLVHNALSDHVIFATEFVNDRIVNQEWIFQHFYFDVHAESCLI